MKGHGYPIHNKIYGNNFLFIEKPVLLFWFLLLRRLFVSLMLFGKIIK